MVGEAGEGIVGGEPLQVLVERRPVEGEGEVLRDGAVQLLVLLEPIVAAAPHELDHAQEAARDLQRQHPDAAGPEVAVAALNLAGQGMVEDAVGVEGAAGDGDLLGGATGLAVEEEAAEGGDARLGHAHARRQFHRLRLGHVAPDEDGRQFRRRGDLVNGRHAERAEVLVHAEGLPQPLQSLGEPFKPRAPLPRAALRAAVHHEQAPPPLGLGGREGTDAAVVRRGGSLGERLGVGAPGGIHAGAQLREGGGEPPSNPGRAHRDRWRPCRRSREKARGRPRGRRRPPRCRDRGSAAGRRPPPQARATGRPARRETPDRGGFCSRYVNNRQRTVQTLRFRA